VSYPVPIERGKVMEFARATQSTNSSYAGDTPVIPATFLTTARLVWEPRDQNPMVGLGPRPAPRPPRRGGVPVLRPAAPSRPDAHVSSRLGEKWEKEGKRGGVMRFARLVTEFRNDAGDVVAEQRSTIIETRPAPQRGVDRDHDDEHHPRRRGPLRAPPVRSDHPHRFVKYQGASVTSTPSTTTSTTPNRRAIRPCFSVGMFQAGLLATYATDWLGAENIRHYTMRFMEQCWPDDTLICEGVVTTVTPRTERARRRRRAHLHPRDRRCRRHGQGRISTLMPADPIGYEVDDGLLRLTLRRPEAGNAISLEMAKAPPAAATTASADPSLRAVPPGR